MFFINGLLAEEGEDYDFSSWKKTKLFSAITLLGDAKTLADNGAKMVEYGVNSVGEDGDNISQVGSAIGDPNGEGKGEDDDEDEGDFGGPIGKA